MPETRERIPFREKVRYRGPAGRAERLKTRRLLRSATPDPQGKMVALAEFLRWTRRRFLAGKDGLKKLRPALVRHVEKNAIAVFRARRKVLYAERRGCKPVRVLWLPRLASHLVSEVRKAKHRAAANAHKGVKANTLPERRFSAGYARMQSPVFRVLASLLEQSVPEEDGFGKFRERD